MALSATIYRFGINLSDMNRNVYQHLSVHVALHPSETLTRMMARLLAYAICHEERLEFTKGLSTDDEPDLWLKSYSDEIEHWIELGKPDTKRLRKALGKSRRVSVFTYGGQDVEQWLQSVERDQSVRDRIDIVRFPYDKLEELANLAERTMEIGVMIQDDLLDVHFGESMFEFKLEQLMERRDA